MSVLSEIIATLWLMLPVYLPNPGAVLFKGKTPMDFGKNFFDGHRILGNGKTWRGFIGGGFVGFIAGMAQNYIAMLLPVSWQEWFPVFSPELGIMAGTVIITMSYASILGRLRLGHLPKEEFGIKKRGEPF